MWKLFILLVFHFSAVAQSDFDQLLKTSLKGSVPTITVKELKSDYEKVVLLDCREAVEYKVSHLKGSKNIGFNTFKPSQIKNIDKKAAIVVYCTIGARSEMIGERLQKMGYKNVRNLYGSIFEWVNQGNVVFDAKQQPTAKVHTYNQEWSKWLLKGEKVF